MASAFIIYIHPQLQQDPNEESAALLRVLVYAANRTAFGGDVPQVPTWTGPPPTVIAALILLYLGLAATMASVLFAILAKQLLNIYASVGVSGSDVESGQSQQRRQKWFAVILHVAVLLLSGLLQLSLLFDSCALTVYLWEINRRVASLVLVLALGTFPMYVLFLILGSANIGFSHFRPFRKT